MNGEWKIAKIEIIRDVPPRRTTLWRSSRRMGLRVATKIEVSAGRVSILIEEGSAHTLGLEKLTVFLVGIVDVILQPVTQEFNQIGG